MAKVLFIQNNYFRWLGLMWISAVLKQHGHETRLVSAFSPVQAAREVARLQPDVVGFHTLTGAHRFVLQAAAAIKQASPEVKTVLGGPHPTFFPDIIEEPHVDFICQGEGEYAMLDLCNRLDSRGPLDDIPNLWAKTAQGIIKNDVRPLIEDLDSLPFPDRDLYHDCLGGKHQPVEYFMAGRGCPHRCAMCFNEKNMGLYKGKGRYVRFRSVDNLVAEIELVRQRYDNRTIRFEDDTFTLKRDWVMEFLDKYERRIDLPFYSGTRADTLDEELTSALTRAGCYMVMFSVESGSERIRNDVLHKSISNEALYSAAEQLHAAGIPFQTTNIFALPGETVEEGFQTIKLNIEMKTDSPWCSVFQPYPSTAIEETVIKEWGLKDLHPDMISDNYHSWSLMDHNPDVRQLSNLHKFAYWTIKKPSLLPVVRQLIKLPPNPAFLAVHRAAHMFVYSRGARLPVWQGFLEGLKVTLAPRIYNTGQQPISGPRA